jgi:hypothetical protein
MSSTTLPSSSNKAIFGARRGKWLDQVNDDPGMTDAFCRVMYSVTRCLDRETFTAKHGDIAIAKRAHKSVSTVERAMKVAEERGHLQIKRPSRREPREITPILIGESRQIDGTETRQNDESRHESRHESRQPERGPLVESKGCAPISQDPQDSHKNKKEEDLKNGNSRGPTAPESNPSTASPSPSLYPEVPRPWSGGWDRLDEPPVLTGEERAALGRLAALSNGDATAAVSS